MSDNKYHRIRCFTNIEKLRCFFENRELGLVDEHSDANILIVDSNFDFEKISENIEGKIKISVDKLESNIDAFISIEYIEIYLDLIEKFVSEDCIPCVAGFEDIKEITKGTLIHHTKINLNPSDDIDMEFEGLDQKLDLGTTYDSVMAFVSSVSRMSVFRLAVCMKVFSESKSFVEANRICFMTKSSATPDEAIDSTENYVEFVEFIAFKR